MCPRRRRLGVVFVDEGAEDEGDGEGSGSGTVHWWRCKIVGLAGGCELVIEAKENATTGTSSGASTSASGTGASASASENQSEHERERSDAARRGRERDDGEQHGTASGTGGATVHGRCRTVQRGLRGRSTSAIRRLHSVQRRRRRRRRGQHLLDRGVLRLADHRRGRPWFLRGSAYLNVFLTKLDPTGKPVWVNQLRRRGQLASGELGRGRQHRQCWIRRTLAMDRSTSEAECCRLARTWPSSIRPASPSGARALAAAQDAALDELHGRGHRYSQRGGQRDRDGRPSEATANFGGGRRDAGVGRIEEIFVAKYSASGAHLWAEQYWQRATPSAGLREGGGCSTAVETSIVGWRVRNGSVGFGAECRSRRRTRSAFLAKLDGNGGYAWAKSFSVGFSGSAYSNSVGVDPTGSGHPPLGGYVAPPSPSGATRSPRIPAALGMRIVAKFDPERCAAVEPRLRQRHLPTALATCEQPSTPTGA